MRTDLAAKTKTELHRMCHEAVFGMRDWDVVAPLVADAVEMVDHPNGVTHRGVEAVRAATEAWWAAFPDMALEGAEYWDTGDCSIMRGFTRGTQEGPLGPFPATGRAFMGAFMELMWFAPDGRITRLEHLYDNMGAMVQLGHVPAPDAM